MLARRYPRADWCIPTEKLITVVSMFDAEKIAKICRVSIKAAENWRIGEEPIPYCVYALLQLHCRKELPECFGKFAGWRLIESKLVPPGGNPASDGVCLSDWPSRREMFQLRQLTDSQAQMICGLIRQRDFYRRQVLLEARSGLMLNGWFNS